MNTSIQLLKFLLLLLLIYTGHLAAQESIPFCQVDENGEVDSDCWNEYLSHLQNMETISYGGGFEEQEFEQGEQYVSGFKIIDFHKAQSETKQLKVFKDIISETNNTLCVFNGVLVSLDSCFNFVRKRCIETSCGIWAIYKGEKLIADVEIGTLGIDGVAKLYIHTRSGKSPQDILPEKVLSQILEPLIPLIGRHQVIIMDKKIDYLRNFWPIVIEVNNVLANQSNKRVPRINLERAISYLKRINKAGKLKQSEGDGTIFIVNEMTADGSGAPSLYQDLQFCGTVLKTKDYQNKRLKKYLNKVGLYHDQHRSGYFYLYRPVPGCKKRQLIRTPAYPKTEL